MKKFLSAAMALIIALSAFGINVFAATDTTTKTEALIEQIRNTKEISIAFGSDNKSTSVDTIYIKGDKGAYDYSVGAITARAVMKNDCVYGFFPGFPYMYVKIDMPTLSEETLWGIIDKTLLASNRILNYVDSNTESINGKSYYVETYNDRDSVTTKFCYEGDDLKLINVVDTKKNSVQNTYIDSISFSVDDSVFEFSKIAVNVTPLLKFLFMPGLPISVAA